MTIGSFHMVVKSFILDGKVIIRRGDGLRIVAIFGDRLRVKVIRNVTLRGKAVCGDFVGEINIPAEGLVGFVS